MHFAEAVTRVYFSRLFRLDVKTGSSAKPVVAQGSAQARQEGPPSHLHPRIARYGEGDARVKAGGARGSTLGDRPSRG